ncbi:putative bifunctional diguanylate cyclase/phosphodiesterase [Aureimonas phyllosphaerae]|uniref:putative bifunctional diguanylate cyclase/phosphodiesterase n=1 Tax=Aureimonas phyllosphaerae TaxID=1166078 RepID=UPI003A5C11CE
MYRLLVQGVKDYAIFMVDPSGSVMNWNEGAERAKGYRADEILGRNFSCFYSPNEQLDGAPLRNLELALEAGVFSEEGLRYRKDGSAFWALVTVTPVYDETGVLLGFGKVTRDMTERRRADQALAYQARSDALTGISNRVGLLEAIDEELRRLPPNGFASLLYIDLDRFKPVNDTFGHSAGDRVLVEVAARLKAVAPSAQCIGRLGGDEFAIMTTATTGTLDAVDLARTIIAALGSPFDIGAKPAMIGASVGIAVAPLHGTDSSTLIRHADLALYQAKRSGRNRACMFNPVMDERALTRGALEIQLRHAVTAEAFILVYQPIVDGKTSKLIGYEALLRWTDQTGRTISPSTFVPLAEELGLMARLGEWVMLTACKEAAQWDPALTVAVNLSPTQLRSVDIVGKVSEILTQTGLRPDRLEIEITETAILEDLDLARHVIHQLREMGVRITLDDFGTGFSSLSLVKDLPLTGLKIDRSFVRGIDGSARSIGIVRAIMTLCESFQLSVTAEGVETQEQREFLLRSGCTDMQGFLFGRPQAHPEQVESQANEHVRFFG